MCTLGSAAIIAVYEIVYTVLCSVVYNALFSELCNVLNNGV
jgi:hypothetical protein